MMRLSRALLALAAVMTGQLAHAQSSPVDNPVGWIKPTGGSSSSSLPDLTARSLSVLDFGAKCDVVEYRNNGSSTASSTTVSTGTIQLPSSAVGKHIVFYNAGASPFYPMQTNGFALHAGGSGYAAGNVLTLSGGSFTSAAQITVDTVSSGVITAWHISSYGSNYTVVPSNPISVTGGSGSGATFDGVWNGAPLATTISSVGTNNIVVGSAPGVSRTDISWYYGTDDGVALQAASDYVATTGQSLEFPAGRCGTTAQITIPNKGVPSNKNSVFVGQGYDSSAIYALGSITGGVLKSAGSGFGFGGGIVGMAVNGAGLTTPVIDIEGNRDFFIQNALIENAIGSGSAVALFDGDASPNVMASTFETDSAIFSGGQYPDYDIKEGSGSHDSNFTAVFGIGATQANIYSTGNGNRFVAPHTFNAAEPSAYANYGVEMDGIGSVINLQADQAKIAAVFVNSNNVIAIGNHLGCGTSGEAPGTYVVEIGASAGTGFGNDVVEGNMAKGNCSLAAANIVKQDGTAVSSTIVADNQGASYSSGVGALSPGTGQNLIINAPDGNNVLIQTAGTNKWKLGTQIQGVTAANDTLLLKSTNTDGTTPVVVPDGNDTTTGMGADTSGDISLTVAANEDVRLDGHHHTTWKGTAPTVVAGTSPSIVGNDNVGRVTVGTSPGTTVEVDFANSWGHAPICTADDETTAAKNPLNVTTVNTNKVIVTAAATLVASDNVSYSCRGYR